MNKNLRTEFSTRQYMLSEDFELYFYSDKKITKVSNHTHDYYEFYILLGGDVQLYIEDEPHKLNVGDMIIIPPEIVHRPEILDDTIAYKRFVFWISKKFYRKLIEESEDYAYMIKYSNEKRKYIYHFDLFDFNRLQFKIFDLIEELHKNEFGKDLAISLGVKDLLFFLNKTIFKLSDQSIKSPELSLCENVLTFIDTHFDEDISLDRLEKEFFVSKYHISHVIKSTMGITIGQYLQKKRLTAAKEAIQALHPVTSVSLMCGFKEYSTFYKAFKKEFGITPKDYLEQCIKVHKREGI